MYFETTFESKSPNDMILEKINFETESEFAEFKPNLSISKQEEITLIDSHYHSCKIGTCKKKFKNKKRFDKHILTHFYLNVYKCEYDNCHKEYKSRENLTLHVKNIHLNIKPYSCIYCFRGFSHRNGKIYHERRFHKNQMSYECSCKPFILI